MFLLKVYYPEDRICNRISVVLRETTLTISDSIETGSPVETEIVRVISLRTTEITEIIRLKKKKKTILLKKRKKTVILFPK